jgi:hypothetical protein
LLDSKVKTSQAVPAGLSLMVKQGDTKTDQALNSDPNAGGFGQEESKSYYKTLYEFFGYLASCFVLLTQIF